MKEELTTKMHSEFTIDQETELKHRAFSALQSGADLETASRRYDVPIEIIKKYEPEYNELNQEITY